MKGPSGRGRYQTKRLWRCAKCGRERVTAGSVTVQACDQCQVAEGKSVVWMELVEAPPKKTVKPLVESTDEGQG
jgi:ribosomal protein L37AE/L43A